MSSVSWAYFSVLESHARKLLFRKDLLGRTQTNAHRNDWENVWFGKLKSYLEIGKLVPNGSYTESAASTILNAIKAAKRCRHTELRTRYEIRLKCKRVKY